jgi:hypothetical protein
METKLRNRGNAGFAIAIATTAIILIVIVIVLSNMVPVAVTAGGSTTSTAGLAIANISGYIYQGVVLVAIGVIIVAGLGLISYLGLRR